MGVIKYVEANNPVDVNNCHTCKHQTLMRLPLWGVCAKCKEDFDLWGNRSKWETKVEKQTFDIHGVTSFINKLQEEKREIEGKRQEEFLLFCDIIVRDHIISVLRGDPERTNCTITLNEAISREVINEFLNRGFIVKELEIQTGNNGNFSKIEVSGWKEIKNV